jgi:hypothetical protein
MDLWSFAEAAEVYFSPPPPQTRKKALSHLIHVVQSYMEPLEQGWPIK